MAHDLIDKDKTLDLDEVLENITLYSLSEAKQKLNAKEDLVPFTVIVEKDQMFVENYPYDDIESCRHNAEISVRTASTFASHYAFCYDGFLMTDQGQLDALIVECATCDMDHSYVIALLYHLDSGKHVFEETPVYIEDGKQLFDKEAVLHGQASKNSQATDKSPLSGQEAVDAAAAALGAKQEV